jgi:P27 family predicted phage terminase small subunit
MRGRKPVPTALRVARGNPGKRPLNSDEPEIVASLPEPPTYLAGEALEYWHEIATKLETHGLLTRIDASALAEYCVVWVRWRKAEREIEKHGQVILSPSGYPVQSPYVSIANKALSHVRAYESEFGMTPSSRSRVKVAKTKTTADKQRERFFGIRGGKVQGIR